MSNIDVKYVSGLLERQRLAWKQLQEKRESCDFFFWIKGPVTFYFSTINLMVIFNQKNPIS